MNAKYRIHYAPSAAALEQAARVGSNMAVIYSVGPCSHLWFDRDPASGREIDEFPIYFDAYPKVASVRRSADACWIEALRRHIRAMSARALELGLKPVLSGDVASRIAIHLLRCTQPGSTGCSTASFSPIFLTQSPNRPES